MTQCAAALVALQRGRLNAEPPSLLRYASPDEVRAVSFDDNAGEHRLTAVCIWAPRFARRANADPKTFLQTVPYKNVNGARFPIIKRNNAAVRIAAEISSVKNVRLMCFVHCVDRRGPSSPVGLRDGDWTPLRASRSDCYPFGGRTNTLKAAAQNWA
jgi:hypothetical protein